jgi:hypothetical protein
MRKPLVRLLAPRETPRLDVAAAFPAADIMPIHNEGWVHFRENASDLSNSFATLGVAHRLKTFARGEPVVLKF